MASINLMVELPLPYEPKDTISLLSMQETTPRVVAQLVLNSTSSI